ncbi:hypothetical protein DENSPDRAFT_879388 [Dentipellis sp. KUC8613]|nr:hypothetical protein DENSPDRAFT_879388 [Dentipellis sp. KUC8613]
MLLAPALSPLSLPSPYMLPRPIRAVFPPVRTAFAPAAPCRPITPSPPSLPSRRRCHTAAAAAVSATSPFISPLHALVAPFAPRRPSRAVAPGCLRCALALISPRTLLSRSPRRANLASSHSCHAGLAGRAPSLRLSCTLLPACPRRAVAPTCQPRRADLAPSLSLRGSRPLQPVAPVSCCCTARAPSSRVAL